MNIWDFLILALVVCCILWAVHHMRSGKQSGCNGCCSACARSCEKKGQNT